MENALPVTTYVLAGFDHNGAFKDTMDFFADKPNVVIVHPKPNEPIVQTLVRAHITPPANIVIACHGGADGTVDWNKYDPKHPNDPTASPSYEDIYAALPRQGIGHIAILSCYGGTGITLKSLPSGAIVHSEISRKTEATSDQDLTFTAVYTEAVIPQIITSLGSLNPYTVHFITRSERKDDAKKVTRKDMLPLDIGIGGKAPQNISLLAQLERLEGAAKQYRLDNVAYGQAVQLVHHYFDISHINASGIDDAITRIADKLQQGGSLNEHEQRVGMAIAAAYLQTSGALEQYRHAAVTGEDALAKLSPGQIRDVQRLINKEMLFLGAADDSANVCRPGVKENGVVDENTRAGYRLYCMKHHIDPIMDISLVAASASVDGQLAAMNEKQPARTGTLDDKAPSSMMTAAYKLASNLTRM